MKKATPTKPRKLRRNPKAAAMRAFLQELRESTHREDPAFWKQFDRDLKADRLTFASSSVRLHLSTN